MPLLWGQALFCDWPTAHSLGVELILYEMSLSDICASTLDRGALCIYTPSLLSVCLYLKTLLSLTQSESLSLT
jgi:hypothetical protein